MSCLEVRGGNEPTDVSLQVPGLEMHVVSRPFRQAAGGGDVHYVSSCGTGRITRLLVADVAGHGQDVADTARILRDLMRRYVNHIDERRFVARINERFSQLSKVGRFATAVVATYFAPTRTLSLVNAGHPPPLLFTARSGTWSILDKRSARETSLSNMPLGIVDTSQYEQTELRLEVGDAVVCYTDSLPESLVSETQQLGFDGLCKLAQPFTADQAPTVWINDWLDRIAGLAPGNLDRDDTTVLLFRVTDGPVVAGLVHRLLAMGRMVTAPLRGHPIPWPEFSMRNLLGYYGPRGKTRTR
jgi:serine phosphatase RsbU (regulator of sigma subunit)